MMALPLTVRQTLKILTGWSGLLLLPVPAVLVVCMMKAEQKPAPDLPPAIPLPPHRVSLQVVTLRISGPGSQTVMIRTVLTGRTVRQPVPVYSLYPRRDGEGPLPAEALMNIGEAHHA